MFHLPAEHPDHDPVMELAMLLSLTSQRLGDLAEELGGSTLEQVWIWLDTLQDAGVLTIRSIDRNTHARTLIWLHPLAVDKIREQANAYWCLGLDLDLAADPEPAAMDDAPGHDREPAAALAVAQHGR